MCCTHHEIHVKLIFTFTSALRPRVVSTSTCGDCDNDGPETSIGLMPAWDQPNILLPCLTILLSPTCTILLLPLWPLSVRDPWDQKDFTMVPRS